MDSFRSSTINSPTVLEGFADPQLREISLVLSQYEDGAFDYSKDLVSALDLVSSHLASNQPYRHSIGIENTRLWFIVKQLWHLVVANHKLAEDDEGAAMNLCLSVARFTRNLVAGEPDNQLRVFENEALIRSLVHRYTTYTASQDATTYPTTRMLIQTISNLVTGDKSLTDKLWRAYLLLPEEQLILLRLLTSPDPKTVSSTLVLILNCTHTDSERLEMLTTAPRGSRLCISMLDRMSALVDSEDDDESQAFNIGYEIFAQIIEGGIIPALYKAISMQNEPITPAQATLLKLLDSYLHRSPQGLQAKARNEALLHMLIDTFFDLAAYTQSAIRRALGTAQESSDAHTACHDEVATASEYDGIPPAPKEFDLLLPKVSEALVLVSQCLISLGLASSDKDSVRELAHMRSAGAPGKVKTTLVTARSADGQGLVESLVETLRLLDVFLPRITFGKVVERPLPPGTRPLPVDTTRSPAGVEGFSYVKRDLVRLLGILTLDNRGVQDRVREYGGIPVVMNLCVVDDRNPYMKEHAILTLRNLLHGNKENQDVVKEIQPVARWDERGVLQSLS